MWRCFLLSLVALCLWSQSRAPVTADTIDRWMKELSNWGRWGASDELGAINLITPEKRHAAAALVRHGISVSLAHGVLKEKAPDNTSPFVHTMNATGINNPGQYSMDTYTVSYHGWAHTHMDSLAHMFHRGRMYNGVPQETVTAEGAAKLGVGNFKSGIVTRAVLMDIPRLKGVKYLEPGTPIYPEDLEAWEKKAAVRVESGDILLIHTGRWTRRAEKGPWTISASAAGLHASCAPWLKRRGVAVLGSDGASDVMPSQVEGVRQPIHQLALIAMGMPILDNCDFDAAAETAARLKQWQFLLVVAPLPVEGGTGSPLNPIAVF